MVKSETEQMVEEAAKQLQDARLRAAFEGYFAVYADPVWGLKASEEDAVFSMIQAVWPEKYADADFTETMRDNPRMQTAVDQVGDLEYDEPWQGDPKDAERFITDVVGIVIGQMLNVGDRVELTDWVEKFPSFQVAPGSKGVVTDVEDTLLSVKMDDHIDGCEEWDNVVQFLLRDDAHEVALLKVIA